MTSVRSFPPGIGNLQIPTTNRRAALAGIQMYAPSTRKANLLRDCAYLGVRWLGTHALPGRSVEVDRVLDDDTWDQLSRRLAALVGRFDAVAVYRRRGGRTGVTMSVVAGDGPVAVLRGSIDGPETLRREVTALGVLERHRPRSFVAPRVLEHGVVNEWAYSVTTPLPLGRHRVPSVTQAIAVAAELPEALSGLPRDPGAGKGWAAAHLDFTPWNLRIGSSGQVCLYDWEEAGFAPPGSDLVLYAASATAVGLKMPIPDDEEARGYWRAAVRRRIAQSGAGPDRLNSRLLELLDREVPG